jgi:phosphonopyruvate decarboxylase
MIEARQFVEAARARGFAWYAGVPCSYLTPFINYVLQDESLHYVSMANEGDAVALIAGVTLGGQDGKYGRGIAMMQNSGLGNAVSPLTSLTWTFRLPQLLIVTWRGQTGVPDEPQHALMGPITPTMLDTMEIPWELFPTDPEAIGPALDRGLAHMDATGRPYALLMQKGSVAAYGLKADALASRRRVPVAATVHAAGAAAGGAGPGAAGSAAVGGAGALPSRSQVLREVVARTPRDTTVVLASTGFCGRELFATDDRPNQLYMVGSMGCVVPLALGVALQRPDLHVLALDGDGAALMRMGAFATVGAYGPPNLQHLLLDNGAHDSTGGQATVSPLVSFADIAAACGYASALDTRDLGEIATWLEAPLLQGPRFARLHIGMGTPGDLPRPTMTPVDVKNRLMQHFKSAGAH